MLLFFLISNIILIILYVLIRVKHKQNNRAQFDFCTTHSQLYTVIVYIFYAVVTLIEFSFSIGKSLDDSPITFFLIVDVIMILCLYENYLNFVAIKGDEVYYHSFFELKIIKIEDIRSVKKTSVSNVYFYDKNNKVLFKIPSKEPRLNEFFMILNKKKAERLYNIEEFLTPNQYDTLKTFEVDNLLTSYGKEFRENYKKFRNKFILSHSLVTVIGTLIIIGLCICNRSISPFILLGLPYVIARAIMLYNGIRNMYLDMNLADLYLGIKYKNSFKNVKGFHSDLFNKIKKKCIGGIVVSVIFSVFFGMIARTPVKSNKLTYITAKYKDYGRDDYRDRITIRLSDSEIEYDIYEYNEKTFDFSFLDKFSEGDTIFLLVNESSSHSNVFYDENGDKHIIRFDYVYGIKTAEKNYFTYSDYVRGFNNYYMVGNVSLYFVGVTVTLSITLFGSYLVCKKKGKGETIEL